MKMFSNKRIFADVWIAKCQRKLYLGMKVKVPTVHTLMHWFKTWLSVSVALSWWEILFLSWKPRLFYVIVNTIDLNGFNNSQNVLFSTLLVIHWEISRISQDIDADTFFTSFWMSNSRRSERMSSHQSYVSCFDTGLCWYTRISSFVIKHHPKSFLPP